MIDGQNIYILISKSIYDRVFVYEEENLSLQLKVKFITLNPSEYVHIKVIQSILLSPKLTNQGLSLRVFK